MCCGDSGGHTKEKEKSSIESSTRISPRDRTDEVSGPEIYVVA